MELVIDRKTWDRGGNPDGSKLLDAKTGKKCCLGFLATACGYTDEQIITITTPAMLLNESELKPVVLKPVEAFGKLVMLSHWDSLYGKYLNTEVCTEMMKVNDIAYYTGEEDAREDELTKLFKEIGVEVIFVDKAY
jgi:hypothetical protein